jgi:hypothetical protein
MTSEFRATHAQAHDASLLLCGDWCLLLLLIVTAAVSTIANPNSRNAEALGE